MSDAHARTDRIEIWSVGGIPEVRQGDDLTALIASALGDDLRDGDIVVVSSKIVSKSEGRSVAADDREDAITAETVRLVASRPYPGGVTRIVENRLGIVQAAAGVDASNVAAGTVLLLPVDPDASARRLVDGLREATGARVGVVITDTLGRAWRVGQTDAAIGAADVTVIDDLRGSVDAHGHALAVTMPAVGDEIAAAADLVKGKADSRPVAVVRGLARLVVPGAAGARSLVRPAEQDMFRRGSDESYDDGYRDGYEAGAAETRDSED